jgi:beta-phosphoglucomutase
MEDKVIEGVIFDLDGVLTATDALHTRAWQAVCDDLDIPFGKDVAESLRGVSRCESAALILKSAKKSLSESEIKKFTDKKNDIYKQSLEELTPEDVFEGVRELIKYLSSKNIKTAVASSSKNAETILKNLDLKDMFDAVVDGKMISRSKPDPEVFDIAAHKLGIPPENCLVVEDAKSGIEAAGKIGCLTVGIGPDADGADIIIQDISEIMNIVDANNFDFREKTE